MRDQTQLIFCILLQFRTKSHDFHMVRKFENEPRKNKYKFHLLSR